MFAKNESKFDIVCTSARKGGILIKAGETVEVTNAEYGEIAKYFPQYIRQSEGSTPVIDFAGDDKKGKK